jgi:hydrogenase maturation protease
MTSSTRKLTVIGVANPFRSDDGVGKIIVERFRQHLPEGTSPLEETGDGAKLLNAWTGSDCVIVVDAVQSGAPPGTIHRLDARNEILPAWFSRCSTHSFGIAEAIELARAMHEMPAELIVYGIEGLDFSPGTELSPEVARVVPTAARLILQEIQNASEAIRSASTN